MANNASSVKHEEDRVRDLGEIAGSVPHLIPVVGLVVDDEGAEVFHSATLSYRRGVDAAAIICAHASCERDLLADLDHWSIGRFDEPPKRFNMWGLGAILNHVEKDLPPALHTQLTQLNDRRKILYHYGHSGTASGIHQSVLEYASVHQNTVAQELVRERGGLVDPKAVYDECKERLLRLWAKESVAAAFALRSWLFTGPSS